MDKKPFPQAAWSIALWVDCPGCEEHVDLLDYPDFWDGRNHIQVGERGTEATKDLEVVCPECGHEFNVELAY